MFEFNPYGVIVAFSWLLVLPRASWVAAVIGLLVFSTKSLPVGLLLLLLMQVLAFIQSSLGTKRENSGISQKRQIMVFAGIFIALFGSALGADRMGHLWVFAGLMLVIPNAFTGFFLNRYYERLTLRAHSGAVLLPALAAIDLLLKIRGEVRSEYAPVWDLGVAVLGGTTLIHSSLLAFFRMRVRPVLIHWSGAWIGLAVFLLGVDSEPNSQLVFSGLAVAISASGSMLSLAAQLDSRHFAFARAAALGMPGLIGFSTLYLAVKMLLSAGLVEFGVLFSGYLFLALALIVCRPRAALLQSRPVRVRFWISVLVQLASGLGMLWMIAGGAR